MAVTAAIVGSSVIGGVLSSKAASKAGKASAAGAAAAADATLEAARLQVEEISRQFDYQQQVLLPQIQQQYMASQAYSDLLGLGNNLSPAQAFLSGGTAGQPPQPGGGSAGGPAAGTLQGGFAANAQTGAGAGGPQAPTAPPPGGTQFQRGPGGEFVDPNLDPTRLADATQLPEHIRNTLLAGTSQAEDPLAQYISANQIAAGTAGEDGCEAVAGAAG